MLALVLALGCICTFAEKVSGDVVVGPSWLFAGTIEKDSIGDVSMK